MRIDPILSALALAALLGASASAATITGEAVLVTGAQPVQAFARTGPGPCGTVHVDMWEVRAGKTVPGYDVDMTKLAHLIVVTDDLRFFSHVHPVLQPGGHFTIDLALRPRELYHLYIDDRASGIGRTVFRFDIPMAGAVVRKRVLHAAGNSVKVGPYVLAVDSTVLVPGVVTTINVNVTRNGKPATDLHPYLGVMTHGVFIGVNDLAYMHAHGMSVQTMALANTNDCGDAMMMSMPPIPPNTVIASHFVIQVLAPSAQKYDLWLQFIGGKTLYTAPLLMTAATSP